MPIQKNATKLFPDDCPLMKTNSELCFAFRVIAKKILRPYPEVPAQDAYATVKGAYSVDEDEANILALYLARPSWRSPSKDPIRMVSLPRVRWQQCMDDLLKRKLVVCAFDWENVDSAYSPDPAFVLSVQYDLCLAEAQEKTLQELFELAVDNPLGKQQQTKAAPKSASNPLNLAWMQDPKAHPPVYDPSDLENDEEELEELDAFFAHATVKPDNTFIKQLDEALTRYEGIPFGEEVLRFTGSLSDPQKMVLFYMIKQFKDHFICPVEPGKLSGAIDRLFSEHVGVLMEKGLVCSTYVWDRANNSTDTEYYRITPEVAMLFKGRGELIDKRVVSSIGSFTPPESIEQKELFFCPEDMRNFDRIRQAAIPFEYDRIIAALKERKLRPCLSVLMYGPPGTGKTELSLQIARETGRALLKVDTSKLHGIYIGEGEINFRNLFQTYRYICAVSDCAPILFLDEGDGLMSKRLTRVERSTDKDANSVQNIILEELNSLPGLVFLTTNLVDNMDDAMFRRFMIKAQFHLPDAEIRAAIWRSKFPSLSMDDAAVLAREFLFSGALIDNVVSMATTDEILYRKPVTLSDLLSYCKSQLVGIEKSSTRKIGFNNC